MWRWLQRSSYCRILAVHLYPQQETSHPHRRQNSDLWRWPLRVMPTSWSRSDKAKLRLFHRHCWCACKLEAGKKIDDLPQMKNFESILLHWFWQSLKYFSNFRQHDVVVECWAVVQPVAIIVNRVLEVSVSDLELGWAYFTRLAWSVLFSFSGCNRFFAGYLIRQSIHLTLGWSSRQRMWWPTACLVLCARKRLLVLLFRDHTERCHFLGFQHFRLTQLPNNFFGDLFPNHLSLQPAVIIYEKNAVYHSLITHLFTSVFQNREKRSWFPHLQCGSRVLICAP